MIFSVWVLILFDSLVYFGDMPLNPFSYLMVNLEMREGVGCRGGGGEAEVSAYTHARCSTDGAARIAPLFQLGKYMNCPIFQSLVHE